MLHRQVYPERQTDHQECAGQDPGAEVKDKLSMAIMECPEHVRFRIAQRHSKRLTGGAAVGWSGHGASNHLRQANRKQRTRTTASSCHDQRQKTPSDKSQSHRSRRRQICSSVSTSSIRAIPPVPLLPHRSHVPPGLGGLPPPENTERRRVPPAYLYSQKQDEEAQTWGTSWRRYDKDAKKNQTAHRAGSVLPCRCAAFFTCVDHDDSTFQGPKFSKFVPQQRV